MKISVARNFSQYPAGRYKRNGKYSGEEFRERFLLPALKEKKHLEIDMDGTVGYPPSFLEEAFGGLVRLGYSAEQIWKFVELLAGPEYEVYRGMARHYVEKEESRL